MSALIPLLLQNLPAIIAQARDLFKKTNPGEPVPTDAEIKAALVSAIASSLATDAAWLASHPVEPPPAA